MENNSDTLIVYLILAHGEPALLSKLIGALEHDNVRFFVHVDAKSDISQFKTNALLKYKVTFITDRVKVYWGGFSMVEATLHLMEAAINDVPDFAYAVLLSGVHYPIKSNDYILNRLKDPNVEYLQYAKVTEVGCEFKINAFCFNDFKLFNPRTTYSTNHKLNILARIPGKLVNLLFRQLVPLVYKRKLKGGIVSYAGANWWALTKPCVQHVLKYVEENNHYKKYFRFATQPDETFFHTIICNSNFNLANQHITLGSMTGSSATNSRYSQLRGLSLTFTKCSSNGSPKILDESDSPNICKEANYFDFPQLFARKFDVERSSRLLRLIDDYRSKHRN
ncbi:hypothetical protein MNBD_GAMMA09-2905 [hydrothermal vent metagenome]|uniref:Peptide O-xylosyltransferase n=1 Tax=hydrothermal vent metagenome TaxID=652676 RepID=A0A3B0XA34_9ZZZZ